MTTPEQLAAAMAADLAAKGHAPPVSRLSVASEVNTLATDLRDMAAALFFADDGQPATPKQIAALDALRAAVKMMEECS